MSTMQNDYAVKLVYCLAEKGQITETARQGFIKGGRGTVTIVIEFYIGGKCAYTVNYIPRATVENDFSNTERRQALLREIDSYQPLTQTVALVISPLDVENVEMTTCLLEMGCITRGAT